MKTCLSCQTLDIADDDGLRVLARRYERERDEALDRVLALTLEKVELSTEIRDKDETIERQNTRLRELSRQVDRLSKIPSSTSTTPGRSKP